MASAPDRVTLVSDYSDCFSAIKQLIISPDATFVARIGGSDTDVVVEYFNLADILGRAEATKAILNKFGIVRRFNGFYDPSGKLENIELFCSSMVEAYLECPDLLLCGSYWLTEFFPEQINPVFQVDTSKIRDSLHKLAGAIGARQQHARFYPYSFVERLVLRHPTLLKLFSETLPGRKVLAVTPFAESINTNFYRRHEFFPDYQYPEFQLTTYNTPITYEGLPPDFYPDENWFATVDRMKHEIELLDFDIALLSCGSYAIPLGLHIRDALGKKAIYVGGCLQLFFGIMGRRYQDQFFTDQINQEAFIFPVERERYLQHVVIGPDTAREAFGAYF